MALNSVVLALLTLSSFATGTEETRGRGRAISTLGSTSMFGLSGGGGANRAGNDEELDSSRAYEDLELRDGEGDTTVDSRSLSYQAGFLAGLRSSSKQGRDLSSNLGETIETSETQSKRSVSKSKKHAALSDSKEDFSCPVGDDTSQWIAVAKNGDAIHFYVPYTNKDVLQFSPLPKKFTTSSSDAKKRENPGLWRCDKTNMCSRIPDGDYKKIPSTYSAWRFKQQNVKTTGVSKYNAGFDFNSEKESVFDRDAESTMFWRLDSGSQKTKCHAMAVKFKIRVADEDRFLDQQGRTKQSLAKAFFIQAMKFVICKYDAGKPGNETHCAARKVVISCKFKGKRGTFENCQGGRVTDEERAFVATAVARV